MKYTAIILAAGQGQRTGLKKNKILHEIHHKRVIDYSLDFFEKDEECSQIIFVINEDDYSQFVDDKFYKISDCIYGGKTRQESVQNALKFIQEKFVIIHDGARPFIPLQNFKILKQKLTSYPSVTFGIKVTDTIQKVIDGYIVETIDRTKLIQTQTPQAFHTNKLVEAHMIARDKNVASTDDTTLLLNLLHIRPFVVQGDKRNIKFTNIDDLLFLEVIL